MPTPRRKKAQQAPTPPPTAPSKPRWRMAPHPDGISMAPVRVVTRQHREREQAVADLYGGLPMPSTGERMLPISSILAEVVSRINVQETELAPELLAQAWVNTVGEFLASQSQLVSLAEGVAGIRTSHPAVRFELQRHKQHIIRALNAELGEGSVQKLRVFHG